MQHRSQLELEARREAAKTMVLRYPELRELIVDLLKNVDIEVTPAETYHGLVKQLKPIIAIIWNKWQREVPIYDPDGDQIPDEAISELLAELIHIVACYEEYMQ
ncbi:hypothetical protein VPHD260_0184 [Vibrio phage D260]